MKIAVLKIGARISFGTLDKDGNIKDSKDTSGGNGEAKAIIKMLYSAGCDVTVLTKILDKDWLPKEYTFQDVTELFTLGKTEEFFKQQDFTTLVILNGNFNCFGGIEKSIYLDLANYDAINKFDKTPWLCLCDIALVTNKDIYNACKSKPWGAKYNESINISRDDIHIVTQAQDLDALYRMIQSDKHAIKVRRENIEYFPFEKFPMFLYSGYKYPFNADYDYDLSYGGTMRANRRLKKLVKFYYNHDKSLKVDIFGKMKQDILEKEAKKYYGPNVVKPTISDPVLYDRYCDRMNKSLAHIVIGDKIYEDCNYIPQRCYEALLANTLTFIDKDLDKNKTIYGYDEELSEMMYVRDVYDFDKKILMLKSQPRYHEKIKSILLKANAHIVGSFDPDKYCKDFLKILNNI